jgi:cell division protein FtsB
MTRKSRRKEQREVKIYNLVLMVSTFIIAGFLIFSNWRMAEKRKELLQEAEALKEEIEMLEIRNQGLEAGISASEKSDYWEAKIREQGYKKPGETAVVIKKEQAAKESETAPKNIWEKFLAEVKGIIE